ncbi:unnamed protein product, partial [Ectocarpus sp. 12 AP-2014]
LVSPCSRPPGVLGSSSERPSQGRRGTSSLSESSQATPSPDMTKGISNARSDPSTSSPLLHHLILQQAVRNPGGTAVFDADSRDEKYGHTFAELRASARAIRRALSQLVRVGSNDAPAHNIGVL